MLPKEWDEVKVKRFFRGKILNITYKKSTQKQILVNGKKLEGNTLNPQDFKEEILNVTVYY